MTMRGYSTDFEEDCACARIEGVDASYKDLAQVCGRVRGKDAAWAFSFLEKASKGEIPVLYKKHNTRLGHRRELGGKKGRYPKKAAKIVLKLLKTAVSNGVVRGLGEEYRIIAANANKKFSYPRMAPKGRRARAYYELARLEMVLKPTGEVPKGVEVTPPKAAKEVQKPKEEAKKEMPKEAKAEEKKAKAPQTEPRASAPATPAEVAKEKEKDAKVQKHPAGGEHKHELEKEQAAAKAHHDRYAYEHGKGKKTVVKNELR